MAARGVNGAAAATLNARFIKCAGCRVNVPKEDMLALGKCTVCGRAYEPEVSDGGESVTIETVAFTAGAGARAATATPESAAAAASKPRRKRWSVLTSKKGRTYYHNTETGEDTWEAPPDLDADAAEDAFVPFKSDAVKNAVLREQAKADASRMGVPMEVIAKAQRREQEEELASDPIAQLGGFKESAATPAPAPAAPRAAAGHARLPPRVERSEERNKEDHGAAAAESDDGDDERRACSVM